ncbi:hypothetical protein ACEE34_03235 [Staphylococcus rostri]
MLCLRGIFENFANRNQYKRAFIKKYDLDPSVAVNLTGRFMMRERQSYSVQGSGTGISFF